MRIREFRILSRMTQKELAYLLSMYIGEVPSDSSISRYESRNRDAFRSPDPKILKALSIIFKIPIAALYKELMTPTNIKYALQEDKYFKWDENYFDWVFDKE